MERKDGKTILELTYDSWKKREYIANHGADFCISPKLNSVDPWYTDFYRYKERHLVECKPEQCSHQTNESEKSGSELFEVHSDSAIIFDLHEKA